MLGASKNQHKNAVVTWDDFMSLFKNSTATGYDMAWCGMV